MAMYQTREDEALRTGRVERRMLAALRAVLPASVPVDLSETSSSSDAAVRIGRHRFSVRWVGRAGLREVRDTLRLADRPDVIVGSQLSLAARAAAGEAALGWVDETGAAEIVAGNLLVSRSGQPQGGTIRPAGWTPSVIGVAEAILCGTPATVAATAEATGHSISSTAHALKTLVEMGLLETETPRGPRSGRHVVDANRLLDDYSAAARQRPKAELRCGVVWRDPVASVSQIGRRWDRAGMRWAATGTIGAAALAPYLTEVTTGEVYIEATGRPELLEAAQAAGIEPMDGGRLLLRPFPTAASRELATETEGLRVAPWPRVYADLRQIGVRGEEAAEHLREVVDGR